MFLGSLVVSRFLSLVAHFVVTVIIFLSKVSIILISCCTHVSHFIKLILQQQLKTGWFFIILIPFQDVNIKACLPLQYTDSEFSSKDVEYVKFSVFLDRFFLVLQLTVFLPCIVLTFLLPSFFFFTSAQL